MIHSILSPLPSPRGRACNNIAVRFVVGLLVGLLALGGYVGWQQYNRSKNPCMGLCADGTACVEGQCRVAVVEGKTKPKRKRRKRRWRRRRRRSGSGSGDEPQLKKASAADKRASTHGPTLNSVDRVDLTKGGGGGRELSQGEVTSKVRRLDSRIVGCITRAREGYEISGRVRVGFRIERNGRINKVRVTAPALLMKRGIYGCIAPLIRSLSYGATSRSLIMTYPYGFD